MPNNRKRTKRPTGNCQVRSIFYLDDFTHFDLFATTHEKRNNKQAQDGIGTTNVGKRLNKKFVLIGAACGLIFFGLLTGFIIIAIHASNKSGDGAVQTTTTMMTTKTTSTRTTQPSPPPTTTKTTTITQTKPKTTRITAINTPKTPTTTTKKPSTTTITTAQTTNTSTKTTTTIGPYLKIQIIHISRSCLQYGPRVQECNKHDSQEWRVYRDQKRSNFLIESKLNASRLNSNHDGTLNMRSPLSDNYQKWFVTNSSIGGGWYTIQNVATSRFLFYNNETNLLTDFNKSKTQMSEALWRLLIIE